MLQALVPHSPSPNDEGSSGDVSSSGDSARGGPLSELSQDLCFHVDHDKHVWWRDEITTGSQKMHLLA